MLLLVSTAGGETNVLIMEEDKSCCLVGSPLLRVEPLGNIVVMVWEGGSLVQRTRVSYSR